MGHFSELLFQRTHQTCSWVNQDSSSSNSDHWFKELDWNVANFHPQYNFALTVCLQSTRECEINTDMVALWNKQKKSKEIETVHLHSRTDGVSAIHMHEAGGRQLITLTLAMALWPWTKWKRMGRVWAVVSRLLRWWWERVRTRLMVEQCCPALQHLPGAMELVFASDGWKEEVSQRHLCISGRCLANELMREWQHENNYH